MTKTQAERSATYRQRRDDRMRRYEAALREIGAYSDVRASNHLNRTGSYGCFHEPESVEIAREVLRDDA